MANNKTISEIIDTDYRDYSRYVVESRAIPSIVDGLKPAQRKALYCGAMDAKRYTKTIALVGSTLAKANYHHGDTSMADTISLMAAGWANNVPLFDGEGIFGNRLVKKAASARYTSVKISNTFTKYFLDCDLVPENPDPENPEPKFYLPIIPWVLLNGVVGIAVGFATEIQPRNLADLKSAVKKALKGQAISDDDLPPFFSDFTGTVRRDELGQWYQVGSFERTGKNTIRITEVPTKMDRDKYIKILDGLEAEQKIAHYTELTSKTQRGFRYDISFKRGGATKTDDQIISMFKLRASLPENLTVIDEHGRPSAYNSVSDLIKDWTAHRLGWVGKRYEKRISDGKTQMKFLQAKHAFITAVLNGLIIINNRSKRELISDIKTNIEGGSSYADRLIQTSVYSMTTDEMSKLSREIEALKIAIVRWEKTDIVSAFISDLK